MDLAVTDELVRTDQAFASSRLPANAWSEPER